MKKSVAEAWIKDLLNPNRRQGRRVLKDGKKYCCLGRLCIVMGAKFKKDSFGSNYPVYKGECLINSKILPDEIKEAAGMKSHSGSLYDTSFAGINDSGTSLAGLNDNGASFKEIAAIIKKNWREL